MARDLAIAPLVQRIEAHLDTLDASARTDKPSFPDGLTEREVEILRLIARGLTYKEVGSELFIAVKTVSSHVGNIHQKIGVSNRSEATACTIKNGLAPSG